MMLSNAAYKQLSRNAGTRNRGFMSLNEYAGYEEPDWLFFTELNAHEVPGKRFLELEE